MEYLKELLDTFKELSALKVRTEDVADHLERINEMLYGVLQRITMLEVKVEELKNSVKSEVLGEVKAQMAETRLLLELVQTGRLILPQQRTIGTSDGPKGDRPDS